MIGSPNYGLYHTNGTQANWRARAGSEKLQNLFEAFIKKDQNLKCALIDIDFYSDQKNFYDASIPTVLIHGGSQDLKTIEQREMFGGEAGAPMDACTELPCDDVLNVNDDALRIICKNHFITFVSKSNVVVNNYSQGLLQRCARVVVPEVHPRLSQRITFLAFTDPST